MDFHIGETLTFESIRVRVAEINIDSIVFEILFTGHEEDEGDYMEVPMWYLEANKGEIKR